MKVNENLLNITLSLVAITSTAVLTTVCYKMYKNYKLDKAFKEALSDYDKLLKNN